MDRGDIEFAQRMLGKRFGTEFTVSALQASEGLMFLTMKGGAVYQISIEELRAVVERGFVVQLDADRLVH